MCLALSLFSVSNATLFLWQTLSNANALEEWSSESDKSEDKESKRAGVQRCRVCVQLNTLACGLRGLCFD